MQLIRGYLGLGDLSASSPRNGQRKEGFASAPRQCRHLG
jgi:hypothetical protein